MEHISKIIENYLTFDKPIVRLKYEPCDMNIAFNVFIEIISKITGSEVKVTAINKPVICELIRYIHGSESCIYSLDKALMLSGATGTGKTTLITAISLYSQIDEVKYKFKGKVLNFNFKSFSANEITSSFSILGFDGIAKYETINMICIDDLGSEIPEAMHFGNRVNVIEQVVEERYRKGLLTHFTTNLNFDKIHERYGDRVFSRLKQTCNFIEVNDIDFRLI